jgi:putative ABC transport system ATP-binding protein
MNSAIELVDITKKFELKDSPTVCALNKVSLTVEHGEMVAITGRSGSGKSTLLHVMGGLVKPTYGNVFIKGQDISKFSDKDMSRFRNQEMGFVFQSFFLEPALCAWENVTLPLVVQKIGITERKKLAGEVLERVDLKDRPNHKPSELSGGEMQRVCIARSIIANPNIIFADEPTGNLDKKSGDNVMEILRNLVTKNTTVIVVTHNQEDVAFCDRTISMSDGKVIG